MDNIKNNVRPRDIVTKEAIDDAFALDMAMGGSTNTVLHTLAIAREAGIDYDLKDINEIAKKTPLSLKLHLQVFTLCMMSMKLEVFQPLLIS